MGSFDSNMLSKPRVRLEQLEKCSISINIKIFLFPLNFVVAVNSQHRLNKISSILYFDRGLTVSTVAAPANIASSDNDEVVFGKGNFNLGCVFGNHKLDSTFL